MARLNDKGSARRVDETASMADSCSRSPAFLGRLGGICTVALLGLSAVSTEAVEDGFDIGPLYDRFRLTLGEGERMEAVGPLLSWERRESSEVFTVTPIGSYERDWGTERAAFDLLYPLLTYDRFGAEYQLQFLQWLNFSGGESQEGDVKRRVTIFPFFFRQQAKDSAESYTAVFPFYGTLRARFFRDEIRFVLFPLYSETRKRDVVTENYVYPFFHIRRDEGLTGWQLWPLYGTEHKESAARTNQFDEIEIIGGYEKRFVLWPFYFNNRIGLGTDNPATHRVLLPFYSIQRSPMRDSATYFWPFGLTITEDRQKKYREWGAPWPLVVFAHGEGKMARRIWPLFSRAKNPTHQSEFYFWPLYKFNRVTSEPLDRTRTRILLFLYSDLVERNTATGTSLQRTDLWPLFTARKDHNGDERLQVLAPIEPLVPNNRGIERNYAPIWSIWRSEKNGKTGNTGQSFFWNLYRKETTATRKKTSLLFGAFGYESGPEGRRLRLFFVPIGKTAGP